MYGSQFGSHAKNHLDQPPMGAGPAGGKAVPKDASGNGPEDVPVMSYMQELCISLGFTADPSFLDQAALEWLAREGYVTVQAKGNNYSTLVCGEQVHLLLRDNIEQIAAMEQMQWEPLLACLTPEWHSRASISEEPILITNMVSRINSCLPGDLPRKLSRSQLSMWMVKKGLMETIFIKKSKRRYPTAAGKELGILFKLDQGEKRVLWSAPAQQFVWDNLDGIVQDLASGDAYRWGPRDVVLSEELRRKLRPVPKLVGLAYLEAVINSNLGGGNGYPDILPKRLIFRWLYQEKYCAGKKIPGRGWSMLSTEKGEAVGLVVSGNQLYASEAGQQFIYDNLQQIFDYGKTL